MNGFLESNYKISSNSLESATVIGEKFFETHKIWEFVQIKDKK